MNVDWETLKYLVILPAAWAGKFVWNNHKSIQEIREEIAADYPTWTEMKREIAGCSEQKDKMINDQKEDLTYIRDKVDKIVDRMLDNKD